MVAARGRLAERVLPHWSRPVSDCGRASPTSARAPSMGQGIEPFQIMLNAKNLPTVEYADCTFVFR
jgi:hypothetical protein